MTIRVRSEFMGSLHVIRHKWFPHEMLVIKRSVVLRVKPQICMNYSSAATAPCLVPVLSNSTLPLFRAQAFQPETPALLPRGHFTSLPACERWFQKCSQHSNISALNTSYLSKFGAFILPLEITQDEQFTQVHQPFQFFLECVHAVSHFTISLLPNLMLRKFDIVV